MIDIIIISILKDLERYRQRGILIRAIDIEDVEEITDKYKEVLINHNYRAISMLDEDTTIKIGFMDLSNSLLDTTWFSIDKDGWSYCFDKSERMIKKEAFVQNSMNFLRYKEI